MVGIKRLAGCIIVSLAAVLLPLAPATAGPDTSLRVHEVTLRVVTPAIRRLPFAAQHLAVYWRGHPDARVTVALSRDGVHFAPAVDAGRDELGLERNNGMTYGALLSAGGAKAARVTSNEPLQRLTLVALADRVHRVLGPLLPGNVGPSGNARPAIISRADWGANESLRFAADGRERWTPTFAPIEKLVVHHTATANGDKNPAATVRAIYQYHAVTQGWGDIGYNFLIDEAGRIYKGRNSHAPGSSSDSITGEDANGNGVTAAHARNFNRGSVGVALLGTLTTQDATPAAKRALEDLLAWKAEKHHIAPSGASPYADGAGATTTFPNIAGHRDVNRTTECPGDTFYNSLPAVRANVAKRVS